MTAAMNRKNNNKPDNQWHQPFYGVYKPWYNRIDNDKITPDTLI